MSVDVFFYFGEKDESEITKMNVEIPLTLSFQWTTFIHNIFPILEKISLIICAIHNVIKTWHILSLIYIINTSSIITLSL